jgi:hypothetical protein
MLRIKIRDKLDNRRKRRYDMVLMGQKRQTPCRESSFDSKRRKPEADTHPPLGDRSGFVHSSTTKVPGKVSCRYRTAARDGQSIEYRFHFPGQMYRMGREFCVDCSIRTATAEILGNRVVWQNLRVQTTQIGKYSLRTTMSTTAHANFQRRKLVTHPQRPGPVAVYSLLCNISPSRTACTANVFVMTQVCQ